MLFSTWRIISSVVVSVEPWSVVCPAGDPHINWELHSALYNLGPALSLGPSREKLRSDTDRLGDFFQASHNIVTQRTVHPNIFMTEYDPVNIGVGEYNSFVSWRNDMS